MVTMSQAALKDAIAGIAGLIENALTASRIHQSQYRITKTTSLLEVMLQDLFHKMIDEKLNSVYIENRRVLKIEDVTSSSRHTTKMTEDMLNNKAFLALVAKSFKKKTKKGRKHQLVEGRSTTLIGRGRLQYKRTFRLVRRPNSE